MNNNTTTNSWKEDILQQFDESAQDYLFPMPNNFSLYNAGMRLTAFRSSDEWLVVFQMINYDKSHTFIDEVSAYGNMIPEKGAVLAQEVIEPTSSNPFWDDNGKFLLDRFHFTVNIKQKETSFDLEEQDYEEAGIDINSKSPLPVQILRIIAHKKHKELFLSDQELLEACGRNGSGIEKFIQLDGWHHPDIADDELPSENPCFISLAEAIAENNKALYHCPEEAVNTHWSQWELDEHRGWE